MEEVRLLGLLVCDIAGYSFGFVVYYNVGKGLYYCQKGFLHGILAILFISEVL